MIQFYIIEYPRYNLFTTIKNKNMDLEIAKVSDAKVQSLGLKFSFSTEGEKLIIEAFCSKDNQKYVGEIITNPFFAFQDIMQLLNEGQFKTLLKNEQILKIKAGAIPIELLPKQKSQIKELKEALSKSHQKQEQMQKFLDLQTLQLNKHANMINDLKTTVEELKSSPNATILTIQEIKGEFSKKIKQLQESVKSEILAIKNQPQLNILSSSEAQTKMEQFSISLREIKDEVKVIKGEMLIQRVNIEDLRRQVKQSTEKLKKQVTDLTTITSNQSVVLAEIKISLDRKIEENKEIIDNHEDRLKKITDDYQTPIKSMEESNQRIEVELKQMNSKIQKVNLLIKKIEQQEKQRKIIESFKWSQQLKSQKIQINGNVVTLNQQEYQQVFCLLNASFSNITKNKQSWAIKYKQDSSYRIGLGVCLKSKMINYNFRQKNIKLGGSGNGLYMIDSYGGFWCHSQKNFNQVGKSFTFDENDVILIEYDPIDNKLRFSKNKVEFDSKNKVEYLQIVIFAPPQDDAYHPFVSLRGQNSSVELIYPIQINK